MFGKMCLDQAGLLAGHGKELPGPTLDVEINPQPSGPAFRQTEEHCPFRTHRKQQLQGNRLGTSLLSSTITALGSSWAPTAEHP